MNASDHVKRLYKSRQNRMIDGVCAGVAEFFGVDPTLVRIAWILLTFLGGLGIVLYVVGMIVIPSGPVSLATTEPSGNVPSAIWNHRFWGILLVILGSFFLMRNLGLWHRWWDISWDLLLPVVLILVGAAFVFGGRDYISNPKTEQSTEPRPAESEVTGSIARPSRLYRSRSERKMFGVCGGLGAHFGVDPTFVRILFVMSAFASFGLTILAYILMAIVVPEEPLIFSTDPV